jgi:hypothetical protein
VIRVRSFVWTNVIIAVALTSAAPSLVLADDDNVLNPSLQPATLASTMPPTGDVNPYGVWRVQRSIGKLQEGHILVSNFNNSANLQGTGSTIVDVSPQGAATLFAQIDPNSLPGPCPGGVGLTTALAVLRSGWVIVGSLPTIDGTSATAQAGCLIVLDHSGSPVETFYGTLINGPWDMTAVDTDGGAFLFVATVLNGTVAANGGVVDGGAILRINVSASDTQMPTIESITVVASGFEERTDPAALVIGPTGLGLSPRCESGDHRDCKTILGRDGGRVLYIADPLLDRIQAIPHALDRTTSAGVGVTFSSGGSLNGPLGLTVSEGGHVFTVNSNDGLITEMNRNGAQIATLLLDKSGTPPGAGALFGLAFNGRGQVVFVDDAANTLNVIR